MRGFTVFAWLITTLIHTEVYSQIIVVRNQAADDVVRRFFGSIGEVEVV